MEIAVRPTISAKFSHSMCAMTQWLTWLRCWLADWKTVGSIFYCKTDIKITIGFFCFVFKLTSISLPWPHVGGGDRMGNH